MAQKVIQYLKKMPNGAKKLLDKFLQKVQNNWKKNLFKGLQAWFQMSI